MHTVMLPLSQCKEQIYKSIITLTQTSVIFDSMTMSDIKLINLHFILTPTNLNTMTVNE